MFNRALQFPSDPLAHDSIPRTLQPSAQEAALLAKLNPSGRGFSLDRCPGKIHSLSA